MRGEERGGEERRGEESCPSGQHKYTCTVVVVPHTTHTLQSPEIQPALLRYPVFPLLCSTFQPATLSNHFYYAHFACSFPPRLWLPLLSCAVPCLPLHLHFHDPRLAIHFISFCTAIFTPSN
ncbi:hypothetical protein KC19_2G291200 [Ceratodon purpureus]|uniref:Uncharacterized protein n=1 Tax=Ceratodon purpureus TaxID=3225 RepID=A0A8T0J2B4_CERPU|nr:hypothetical protein KC19_2G291200 [Ceratodon purpureus]